MNANEISGDGRCVTLASEVSGTLDDNLHDIFIFDRNTKTLEKPNLRTLATPANGSNYDPVFDFDGRFMAFASDDSRLISGDTNNTLDIFVYDRVSRSITRVNQSKGGSQANQASSSPAISLDGRFVPYSSSASNLVPGDNNSLADIFVVDAAGIEQVFVIRVTKAGEINTDFGDAPNAAQSGFVGSYPTTIEQNGARHRMGTLRLGAALDAEPNGVSSPNATADDTNGVDDEDGIRFATPIYVSATTVNRASIVVVASGTGQLNRVNASPGSQTLPEFDPAKPNDFQFMDVNGDGSLSPLDVLEVINAINGRNGNAEGESTQSTADLSPTANSLTDQFFASNDALFEQNDWWQRGRRKIK